MTPTVPSAPVIRELERRVAAALNTRADHARSYLRLRDRDLRRERFVLVDQLNVHSRHQRRMVYDLLVPHQVRRNEGFS
jgi:hypothetical protein